MRVIENKVINLVGYGQTYATNSIPNIGDYGHWNILSMVPCEKMPDGRYIDVRTGKPVQKPANSQEWPIMVGSVLHYKDDANFLLTRRLDNRKLMLMQISDADIHPETMYRIHLRDRRK